MSERNLRYLESGKQVPQMPSVYKLAQTYNVTLDSLCGLAPLIVSFLVKEKDGRTVLVILRLAEADK
jgi:transcriptional regulator with XRE-family HTH domain